MKKKVIKKYRLKENVKAALMIAWIFSIMFGALLYQAGKVEEEKQEKEKAITVSVNQTR